MAQKFWDLKQEAQEISSAVQAIVEEEDKQEIDEIVSEVDAVSIFWQSNTRGNEGRAAERSDSWTGLQTSHSRQEA